MCQAQLSTNGYGIAGFHAHFLTLFCIRNGDRTAFRLQDLDVIFRLGKYREVYLIRTLGLSILGGNDQGSLGRSTLERYGSRERSCRFYGNRRSIHEQLSLRIDQLAG